MEVDDKQHSGCWRNKMDDKKETAGKGRNDSLEGKGVKCVKLEYNKVFTTY